MFKNKWTKVLSILLIIMMSFLVGCDEDVEKPVEPEQKQEDTTEAKIEVSGDLEVHYIDVGQGDSILIKQSGSNMLIDARYNQYGQRVVDYLKNNGVNHLDVDISIFSNIYLPSKLTC